MLLAIWSFGLEGARAGKGLMLALLAAVLCLPAGRLREAIHAPSRTKAVRGLVLVLDTARKAGLDPLLPLAASLAGSAAG